MFAAYVIITVITVVANVWAAAADLRRVQLFWRARLGARQFCRWPVQPAVV